jgi:hypothetical protein
MLLSGLQMKDLKYLFFKQLGCLSANLGIIINEHKNNLVENIQTQMEAIRHTTTL